MPEDRNSVFNYSVHKIPPTFELTSAPQLFLTAGLGKNETQRAHSILPSVFCVFPCDISSTAAHILLSKADGQIGDTENLPTAIAWECPWATGDNWNEISDQTGETSKFTQLETVYTDLCKKRSVTLPSLVQSHSDAPRPVLSSNYSLICWEVFQLFQFLFALTGLQEENGICFSSGCAEPGGVKEIRWPDVFHLFCHLNRWAALLLMNLLSQQGNTSQSPEGNGLEVFSYFLVSSGGGKTNFCPNAFNLVAFNHSIWCKRPEIISKVDAKINLLSPCTNRGLLIAWHRDVDLSGMDALLAERPATVYADSSILPVTYELDFLVHISSHFSELGCRTQQRPQWAFREK